MSKRTLFLNSVIVSALVLPLMNCGGSSHDPNEAYYLVAANRKIPYWQAAAAGLGKAAGEMKVKWEMVGSDTYDPQAEKEEFQRIVRTGKAAGIMVSAAAPAVMQPEIDAAIAQGIPVITIDSDAPASKRLLFVGTDNYDAGQMAAKVVVSQLKGKGNVVIFTITDQQNQKERMQGYEQVFRTAPGIKISEVVDMKGDPRMAFDRTMEILEKSKPPADAFACLEALACPEVAEVLTRQKVEGKVVVAMDTDPRTLEFIQKGLIAATVAQRPYTMAYVAAKVLDDVHHNKSASLTINWAQDMRSPLPTFIDTGAVLVDKTNVDTFLKAAAAEK